MLGGEAFVSSLMDVIGRAPSQALAYSPCRAPDAVPADLSVLRAAGQVGVPGARRGVPAGLAPPLPLARGDDHPRAVLGTWPRVVPLVVEAVCYTRFPSLETRRCARCSSSSPGTSS